LSCADAKGEVTTANETKTKNKLLIFMTVRILSRSVKVRNSGATDSPTSSPNEHFSIARMFMSVAS